MLLLKNLWVETVMPLLTLQYPNGPLALAEETPVGTPGSTSAFVPVANLLGLSISSISLSGPAASLFTLDVTSGLLGSSVRFAPTTRFDFESLGARNFEGVLNVNAVNLITQEVVGYTSAVSIGLTDTNDTQPFSVHFASGGAAADGVSGATVGTLTALDSDTVGSPLSFQIVGGHDAGLFQIASDGVTLSLKSGAALHYGTQAVYAVDVRAFDGVNYSVMEHLGINAIPTIPGTPPPAQLQPGQTIAGFSYADAGTVATTNASWVSAAVDVFRNVGGHIVQDDGTSVNLAGVQKIVFADGQLDLRANSNAQLVDQLYQGLLGREADARGLSTWTNALDHGGALRDVANAFLNSGEFFVKFGQQGNAEFVHYVYEHGLARTPDSTGLAFWTGLLNNGATRADIAVSLLASAEGSGIGAQANLDGKFILDANALTVTALFDGGLNRLPETGGLQAFKTLLDAGQTSARAVSDIVFGSGEFTARHAGLSNADFVQSIYHDALERDADPGGLNFFTTNLNTGAITRADVLYAVALSEEALNQVASHYHGPATDLA